MTTTALREETVNVAGKPIFVAEAGDGLAHTAIADD
jgi:hypothetical protein